MSFPRVCAVLLTLATAAGAVSPLHAQIQFTPGVVKLAGKGNGTYNGDGIAATTAALDQPIGIGIDGAGNFYIADNMNNRIRKVTAATGLISTIAGTGTAGYSGDGAAAISAQISGPTGLALDSTGNVYFSDGGNNRVRKITVATGLISTVAGNGTSGYAGDGAAATSAEFNGLSGLTIDSLGNIYIADFSNNRVRKVTVSSGIVTTVAGNGTASFSGDGGAAISAAIDNPSSVALDNAGNIYIADGGNNRIRKVTVATGKISTVAGNGTAGYTGDGGAATSAELNTPYAVATDSAGNVYIADNVNCVIREVSVSSSDISTVLGNGTCGNVNGAALSSELNRPQGIALSSTGTLYVSDSSNGRVKAMALSLPMPVTAIGSTSATQNYFLKTTAAETITSIIAAKSLASSQEFSVGTITGCTVDGSTSNASGTVCTVPITFSPGYPGARLVPLQVATSTGSVSFGLSGIGTGPLAALTPGIISTVAGNGTSGYLGDGGQATSAELHLPQRIAVDSAGNIFLTDNDNYRVRKVTASSGVITTVAGNGSAGPSGLGGQATSASLLPRSIAVDSAGNLYISVTTSNLVAKVTVATGIIGIVAGDGTAGYTGDGGPATSAELQAPGGIAVDGAGNLYIADTSNNVIREVNASTGVISTIAGYGVAGHSGDSGPATSAQLYQPASVSVDSSGNLYIADDYNHRVRKVDAATGIITTIAGTGTAGFSGDGGLGTSAMLDLPTGVAADSAGNVYIADSANNRFRMVNASTGIITTIAGSGSTGYTGDGGAATSAGISSATDLALDGAGNVYIVDAGHNVVRKINVSQSKLVFPTATTVGTSDATDDPLTATLTNIGNASLTFPPPGSGNNPSVATYFSVDASSTCPQLSSASSPQTLAADGACTFAIDFNPTVAGAVTGSVVVTDTSLNAASASQTINTSGTAIAVGTTTSLASSLNPSTYSVSVTFTATVAPVVGTVLPTGTVQFSIDGTPVGNPVTLNSSATATYSTSSLALGSHSVTAAYTTNSSNCTSSTSSTLTQTVGQTTGSVTLATSNASVSYGTSITFTATLPAPATGTVTFKDGSSTIGTASVSSGVAAITIATLAVGSHSITAAYSGDSNYTAATSSAVSETISKHSVAISLTSSVNPATYGDTVKLTATFVGTATTPTGTATLWDGATNLATLSLSAGVATYTNQTLTSGNHNFKIIYNGDSNYM